ncbi:MAG TPA: tRNA (adenosine(37)-N6)-dimethylallyltransferase MiaA [Bacteroidota bacterium]|nr:tRNA (adenosine(37)-N6)-dimethylallyltransferase MiaA [Bacteroidota bacterium]
MPHLPRVLALVGPTASGKTPLSCLLAEQLNGEIISADSRQVYKHLDIGTAKPSREQLKQIKHHFIDILEPTEEYSAGQYGKEALSTVKRILQRGRFPILVGGSGLYIRAVIDGLFEGPGKDPEVRFQLEQRLREEGAEALLEQLKKVDPQSATMMSPSKPRRILRALEVYYITGKPLSKFHAEQQRQSDIEFVQFGLHWDRKELYKRINERVDRMMQHGFLDEVRGLKKMGLSSSLNALNTVGYKELFEYLDGKLRLDEAVELIKRNTRRFAKRQLTWFRADKRIRWIAMSTQRDFEAIAKQIREQFISI